LHAQRISTAGGVGQTHRPTLNVDPTSTPALQYRNAPERGRLNSRRNTVRPRNYACCIDNSYAVASGTASKSSAAREINLRRNQFDAPCLRMAAPQSAPGVEADNELRRAQQRFGVSWLVELNVSKYRLGAIPTPT
jgi:hypothetical protein